MCREIDLCRHIHVCRPMNISRLVNVCRTMNVCMHLMAVNVIVAKLNRISIHIITYTYQPTPCTHTLIFLHIFNGLHTSTVNISSDIHTFLFILPFIFLYILCSKYFHIANCFHIPTHIHMHTYIHMASYIRRTTNIHRPMYEYIIIHAITFILIHASYITVSCLSFFLAISNCSIDTSPLCTSLGILAILL